MAVQMDSPPVLVPQLALRDLLDLIDRAIPALAPDPLADALRGAVHEVRCHSLTDPTSG